MDTYDHPESNHTTVGTRKGRIIKFRHGEDDRWEERFILSDAVINCKNKPDFEKACGIYRMYHDNDAIWERHLKEDPVIKKNNWTKMKWMRLLAIIKKNRTHVLWYQTKLLRKCRSKQDSPAIRGDMRNASQSGSRKMKGKWDRQLRIVKPIEAGLFANQSTTRQSNVLHKHFSKGARSWGVRVATQPSMASIKEFKDNIGIPMDFG